MTRSPLPVTTATAARWSSPAASSLASDGANRAFVIAHEYGHHVANHRRNPPFVPTVSYGTKRWGTHERVCPGTAPGPLLPGQSGQPLLPEPRRGLRRGIRLQPLPGGWVVTWNWDESLRPDAGAYAAIRADVMRPWLRRARLVSTGTVGMRRHAVTRKLATPLDGDVSLKLRGEPGAQLDLLVRNGRGRLLATAAHFGANERLQIPVCGQRALRVTIRRPARRAGGEFRLIVRRP